MTLTEIWNLVQEYFSNPWYLGMGCALVVALFWFMLLLRRPPKAIRAFSDASGEVLISLQALTDLVRASCNQLEGISKPRIRLKTRRGVTSLRLHLRLESGARIREIREALKNHLKNTLQSNLGFENLGEITIVIDEYKTGPLDNMQAPAALPAATLAEPAPQIRPEPVKEEEKNHYSDLHTEPKVEDDLKAEDSLAESDDDDGSDPTPKEPATRSSSV